MKRWLRRLLILLIVAVWLIIASFPVLAFVLATNDEIMIGQVHTSHLRLFMVSSDEHRGIGFERSRRLTGQPGCYRTTVNFLLWKGEALGQNTEYCACYHGEPGTLEPLPLCESSNDPSV